MAASIQNPGQVRAATAVAGGCYNPGVRSAVYLLLLLAGLTLFVGLDHPAITDSDEAFYAEAGREMLAGGDWLTSRIVAMSFCEPRS